MSLVPFKELMAGAERGRYAVGYFESWNLESLQAVADAAEATRSPVILGFSGLYLPHHSRIVKERLSLYAALGLEACRSLTTPACLIFNESPHIEWVLEAVALGFSLVMYSDETLGPENRTEGVRQIVAKARPVGVAVEGEVTALPGVGGQLSAIPDDLRLTGVEAARAFVERTDVDALAVSVGQAHLHGRSETRLNLARLVELGRAVSVPLVMHGASSVSPADVAEAIGLGIRKINVGSMLKRAYFEAVRHACAEIGGDYNPYEVVGSGLASDVLTAGRVALQKTVADQMRLFGSAGQA